MKNCLSQKSFVTYTSNQNFISPIPASIRLKSKKRSDLAFSSLCNSPNPRFSTSKLVSILKNPSFSDLSIMKKPKSLNCSKLNLFKNPKKKIVNERSLQMIGKTFINQQRNIFISPVDKITEIKPLKVIQKTDFPKLARLSEKKLFIRNLKQLNTALGSKHNSKKPKSIKLDHLQDLYSNSSAASLTGWDY